VSSPGDAYYQSAHWKALRKACLERDGHHCTVPGCTRDGCIADHKVTRPQMPYPTPVDVLSNLRTLCRSHDAQVKEMRRGASYVRKQGGAFKVRGCDAEGWPFDPRRR
jgi:5-methylcytosine-specific restriction endonuclease McrA